MLFIYGSSICIITSSIPAGCLCRKRERNSNGKTSIEKGTKTTPVKTGDATDVIIQ